MNESWRKSDPRKRSSIAKRRRAFWALLAVTVVLVAWSSLADAQRPSLQRPAGPVRRQAQPRSETPRRLPPLEMVNTRPLPQARPIVPRNHTYIWDPQVRPVRQIVGPKPMSPSSNGPAPANVRRPGSPDSELSIVQPESANAEPADSTVRIPITSTLPPGSVQVDPRNGRVSIVVPDAPLNEVLSALARNQGLNIISAEDITARVSITLHDIPFEQALTQILSAAGCTWTRQDNVLIVTTLSADRKLTPQAQGRQLRVFPLDYVSAVDVDLVVKGLVSAAGQSFATSSTDTDNRKTQETIVVEDLPEYLARIEQYIQQIDQPPRQVLIEVHILSVELQDDAKHGVNFEYLKKLGTPEVTLKTAGFADAGASPAFLFNIAAGELNLLLEALETTNDAKTLATPKVLALNGQEARIQIGEQLGFRVTTTTQTSTMESVEFLDVGVVLRVTPRITRDNHVVMTVKPEVSSGEINPKTELPEEETTEVETSLMLPDGHGMVIGGLIRELDIETQTKIPVLGDLWLIGRLFQKRELKRKREEIIIALIPHVVPYAPVRQQMECDQFRRATTPLLYGPVRTAARPDEPRFPDAGQPIFSIPYKTQHLRTIPDPGCWSPRPSLERCNPGGMPPPIMPADETFLPPEVIPTPPQG